MATLSASSRTEAKRSFCENVSRSRESFSVSSADVDAAVAAIDQWLDDNTVTVQGFAPGFTAAQVLRLLETVIAKRKGRS